MSTKPPMHGGKPVGLLTTLLDMEVVQRRLQQVCIAGKASACCCSETATNH